MHNKIINLALVAQVAHGLQELKDKMVFVGGAVISLYTDDAAAEEIRPTSDIDMTINLANYAEWAQMQERLAELEFYPDPEGHAICSYKYKGIAIDIMPAEDSSIGVSNKWYKPGFKYLQQTQLEDGTAINMLPSPYFLATKLEAFKDRGQNDFYGSHDYEDIIYLLDNRTTIVEEILAADEDVRQYIKDELTAIKNHPQADEILAMHIHPLIREERFKMLMVKIERITDSNNNNNLIDSEKNILSFSDEEVVSLKDAIKYFRAREGSFSGDDPLLKVLEKLNNKKLSLNVFTEDEIKLLLKVINENIEFIHKYEGYNVLSQEESIIRKQQILESLYQLRKKVIKP
ncbi:nucleotidyl transferase AbiEii/AbiGii toxin family protein [Flavobacterium capsici]|uniref:Nucleotidyl transferase AbiEii/AbiGii toxin family protein n=2 Tax=Flavobacterium capsici TaxID=3075618 RepID=A0AA96F3R5_9FLAO|nr:nucleotidyl transferase AbiEii/AbiGii toxin family protein [Flavobacterium sp. PMTSA4]WNM20876.1 nucleotidyl transferase AbiEii/AbiGii toxin family protein [Flavobacterium sp. PMTSA4]